MWFKSIDPVHLVMEIIFSSTEKKYQLIVPPNILRDLDLTTDDGLSLPIFHENKMSMDWLSRDIQRRYEEWLAFKQKANKGKKVKLIVYAILFCAALFVILFSEKMASMLSTAQSVVKLISFVVLVISGWAMLQISLLSNQLARTRFNNANKSIGLRQTIIDQFSPNRP